MQKFTLWKSAKDFLEETSSEPEDCDFLFEAFPRINSCDIFIEVQNDISLYMEIL